MASAQISRCPFPFSLFSPFVRVRVSQDGQFLHYIFPYQFMDSPEWESLQPSEEGTFQVIRSPRVAQAPATGSLRHCYLPLPLSPICPLTTTKCDAKSGQDNGPCLLLRRVPGLLGLGNREGWLWSLTGSHVTHEPTTLPKD